MGAWYTIGGLVTIISAAVVSLIEFKLGPILAIPAFILLVLLGTMEFSAGGTIRRTEVGSWRSIMTTSVATLLSRLLFIYLLFPEVFTRRGIVGFWETGSLGVWMFYLNLIWMIGEAVSAFRGEDVEGPAELRLELDDLRLTGFADKELDIFLQDERQISVPLAELDEAVRPGCLVCTDFTAVEADVSAGAVGSPGGYTTLIIRNDIGRGFVDRAVWQGKLATGSTVDLSIIERLAAKKAERQQE